MALGITELSLHFTHHYTKLEKYLNWFLAIHELAYTTKPDIIRAATTYTTMCTNDPERFLYTNIMIFYLQLFKTGLFVTLTQVNLISQDSVQ